MKSEIVSLIASGAFVAIVLAFLDRIMVGRQRSRIRRLAELNSGSSERYFEERRSLEAARPHRSKGFIFLGLAGFFGFVLLNALLSEVGLDLWLNKLIVL